MSERISAGSVRSSDGTTIAFDCRGEGPTLILVDGALSYRGFGPLAGVAQALAQDFTLYAYDRRARGDTAPYAVAREVEDLEALITASGGSANVCGMSSGAALALEVAASGLAISGLVPYEPPFTVAGDESQQEDEFAERLDRLLAAGRRGDAVEWFLSSAGVPADALAQMRAAPEWPLFEAIAPTLGYDDAVLGDGMVPRERAAQVMVPTLVANGADSPGFFQQAARATADAIPGARDRALARQRWGQGDPEALAALLREFL